MTKQVWVKIVPFDKNVVTLALESGVDGIVVDADHVEAVQELGRCVVKSLDEFQWVAINEKEDEDVALAGMNSGHQVILTKGWEIIPVENILAQADGLGVEVETYDQAMTAAGILERGVDVIMVLAQGATDLKKIVAELKLSQGNIPLSAATITEVQTVGLGHRVCVDTMSVLKRGQGMLVGNSSAFTFLVHAETESNPYVAARPFRINAGAVHAYAAMPGDKTNYLEELQAGDEVLVVDTRGDTSLATIGRVKVEVRPMLLIRAKTDDGKEGAVFLQNAETIRVVSEQGEPVSVVKVKEGDRIMCRPDKPGRHFGMRIEEEIKEG